MLHGVSNSFLTYIGVLNINEAFSVSFETWRLENHLREVGFFCLESFVTKPFKLQTDFKVNNNINNCEFKH